MNALRAVFERARQENRAALITYLMAGDPSVPDSLEYFKTCAKAGADILEVGFPFSDPIADGPTIAAAATRSLQGKTSLKAVFALCGELRSAVDTPLVLMGYVNPVLSFGVDAFFAAMAHNGVDGLIVPDLPLEESATFLASARAHGRTLVPLVAPTTGPLRVKQFVQHVDGFVYYVAVNGVTGARAAAPTLGDTFQALKHLSLPVAVGFGVNTKAHVEALNAQADAVVVGSALVSIVSQPGDVRTRCTALSQLVASLKSGTVRRAN